MLEISEVQEVEEIKEQQEDEYGLNYTIEALYYGCVQTHGKPHICLKLGHIGFHPFNNSHIYYLDNRHVHHGDHVFLCLNAKTFARMTKYWWDGTKAGLESIKEYLVGRKFKINLNIT